MTNKPQKPIGFIDLKAQREFLGQKIDDAVMNVVNSCAFIMGPQVQEFEKQLAQFGQAELALSCANGTDAIALPLMAWGVGYGDAVFCPSFTFAATAEIIPWVGATGVFVDVLPDTYNMDPKSLEAAIEMVLAAGKLTPKVVIAVDLFGQLADYPAISAICKKYGLKLISDSAQGFGATLDGKHPMHWADCQTTSFFPAKPLGCYGDGGAVLTNSETDWQIMDSLRIHGKAVKADLEGRNFDHDPKYMNMRIGMNSRLDTIQAAVLIEKLAVFQDEIGKRNMVAARYNRELGGNCIVPTVIQNGISVWAQYTIELRNRDGLSAFLREKGIPSASYYPIPMHRQGPYQDFLTAPNGLPITEKLADVVISLPMHPYMDEETQSYIIASVKEFCEAQQSI
ncbi:MAG: DegT/DnrJ/EryC1/StrS aminotransferase [Hyphomonadaceae bacterium]|nr:MAG: DegT/DnrJ/EryC1/StrS aminotransferase [Hyphomonadaceae bacterium]